MARLSVPIPLRWGDLDAYGHVNNATLFRLLEEARVRAFWRAPGEAAQAHSTAVLDAAPESESWSLIARQEMEYLAPIPYLAEPLDIQVWISKLGGASLEICYEVLPPIGDADRHVLARAATTIVLVDSTTQRPRRISDEERAAWQPYLEEPVQFSRRP
jgi:acyl-CoA thioester hydrolase